MALTDLLGAGESQSSQRIPKLDIYFDKCSDNGFTITADVNKRGFEKETIKAVFCCPLSDWNEEEQICESEPKLHYVMRFKRR